MKKVYRFGYYDKIHFDHCVACFDTLQEVIERMQLICTDDAYLFEFVEVAKNLLEVSDE